MVALVVDWATGGPTLMDHIQNGVCRGLYTQELADEALLRIRALELEIGTQFNDIARKA